MFGLLSLSHESSTGDHRYPAEVQQKDINFFDPSCHKLVDLELGGFTNR